MEFVSMSKVINEEGVISDTSKLRLLHILYRDKPDKFSDAARKRRGLHSSIQKNQENGKIAVIWSGMDCDCVKYLGEVHIMDADWRVIDRHIEQYYKWADGPCGYYFERPSVAKTIFYRSSDLALAAFENGHPHSIHC